MADDEPRAGEAVTANYGWTKPNVMGSDDQWGGYLNADLDGIDSVVHTVSGVASAAYPASNPAGYITASAIPAPYVLPTASTTILGGVKVDGSTVTAAGDGTLTSHASGGIPEAPTDGKLYSRQNSAWTPTVVPMGDNRIINGDMRIDQRNGGASGTATGYTVDRWAYAASQASKGTWQQGGSGGAALPIGFTSFLLFTSSSAFASAATDFFYLCQRIEADMITDFCWGRANAQPVTLSFWTFSSLTGTFSGAIRNDAGTRSYPFSYAIPVASTWTKIVVTIPGDTAGTWVMSGNAIAAIVEFDLGCGANFRGPAGSWASANYIGVTGAVSIVGTNGAVFDVTGVKLEIGSVATPYNRQSLAKSMADCQRYYQKLTGSPCIGAQGYASSAGAYSHTIGFPSMRAAPTASLIGSWTNTNVSLYNLYAGLQHLLFQLNTAAVGVYNYFPADATGAMTLNAEL